MKKQIILTLFIIGCSFSAMAQTSLSELLGSVERNNPKLITGAKSFIATTASLRMGRNPEDPEIEYSRVFSDESTNELTLKQRFDFPSIYHQRNKEMKFGVQKAELEFKILRKEVLSQVTELYVTAVALNTKLSVLTNRLANTQRLKTYFDKKLEKGETTILEKNKITALYVNTRSEVMMVRMELDNLLSQLTQMNGGVKVTVNTTTYPDFSSIESALNVTDIINRSYNMQAASIDSLITQTQIKIAKQSWIPQLSIGYKAVIEGSKYNNGLVAGISVPLWKNRGNVKHAKAQNEVSFANYKEVYTSQKTELESLVRSYVSYQEICKEYDAYMIDSKSEELLIKALENGAITMTDYLVELSLLYDTIDLANKAKESLFVAKAKMTKYIAD